MRTHATGAHGDSATDPAVACDDEPLAREQHVRRADDAVDRRLPRAVAVVEEVLRPGLVDGDHREAQLAVALERPQADHAGRRLLRPRDDVAELLAPVRVQHADHVGAVVHRHVRPVVDCRLDVLVVRVVVLALDREHADLVLGDEGCGDVVLGRERIGCAEHDVGSTGFERAHQVRRLGCHMEAGGDAIAGERLLTLEPLPDRDEHRHLAVGPRDAAHSLGCEAEVLDVVALCRGHDFLLGRLDAAECTRVRDGDCPAQR